MSKDNENVIVKNLSITHTSMKFLVKNVIQKVTVCASFRFQEVALSQYFLQM